MPFDGRPAACLLHQPAKLYRPSSPSLLARPFALLFAHSSSSSPRQHRRHHSHTPHLASFDIQRPTHDPGVIGDSVVAFPARSGRLFSSGLSGQAGSPRDMRRRRGVRKRLFCPCRVAVPSSSMPFDGNPAQSLIHQPLLWALALSPHRRRYTVASGTIFGKSSLPSLHDLERLGHIHTLSTAITAYRYRRHREDPPERTP
ncbi:hypothetical protein C8F01DRAFT_1249452 [Mycena amicta]|nr:hypothetical protein C8F01DRAFT_1249452 [Mycena amicta]